MRENDLAYTIALQMYARTLLELLRACSGLKKRDVAKFCGVSSPLISQWLTGIRPMAPAHEHALRRLLTHAVHGKRLAVAAMDAGSLTRLQGALMKALVNLDSAWLTMNRAYSASVKDTAKAATAFLDDIQAVASTPAVVEGAHESARAAFASLVSIPGLWTAIKARNRALRALVEPTAAADVRANVKDLLDYAEKIYGLEENETSDTKGPTHRRRGRPKKKEEATV